ncbi:MAG: M20/M25/M40 family metallo-hydrolase [Candidatus Saganbacteria bacterium]|nr:M20/M25/M40 family metallo-hydrolase [Candidatus Saganbacteria bacterium]
MIKEKRLINTFLKLVKIESPSKREKNAGLFIKKYLAKLGIKSWFDDAGDVFGGNCGNLYAAVKGTVKEAPGILLNAHIDTVVHDGRIHPVIRKGVISSDGTTILGADCKAGVAAILEALKVLKEKNILHGDIKLCFTVAEEIGITGAKNADFRHLRADFGYVLDGGAVETILCAAPSQLNFEANIHGRAAHAGVHPERGINAIKVASEAISKMKIGRIDRITTANVGIIEGGTATNIIPDRVFIKGEVRSHSKRKLKQQINNMTKILSKTCRKHKAFLRMKVEPVYNSFSIKESSPAVKYFREAGRRSSIKIKTGMTGGGSDANIFNEMGIPSVIIGVGAHNLHTAKECIAVGDLVTGTELLIGAIQEAADGRQ